MEAGPRSSNDLPGLDGTDLAPIASRPASPAGEEDR